MLHGLQEYIKGPLVRLFNAMAAHVHAHEHAHGAQADTGSVRGGSVDAALWGTVELDPADDEGMCATCRMCVVFRGMWKVHSVGKVSVWNTHVHEPKACRTSVHCATRMHTHARAHMHAVQRNLTPCIYITPRDTTTDIEMRSHDTATHHAGMPTRASASASAPPHMHNKFRSTSDASVVYHLDHAMADLEGSSSVHGDDDSVTSDDVSSTLDPSPPRRHTHTYTHAHTYNDDPPAQHHHETPPPHKQPGGGPSPTPPMHSTRPSLHGMVPGVLSEVTMARDALDLAYLTARRDMYYDKRVPGFTDSEYSTPNMDKLLTLNAFIFNVLHVASLIQTHQSEVANIDLDVVEDAAAVVGCEDRGEWWCGVV